MTLTDVLVAPFTSFGNASFPPTWSASISVLMIQETGFSESFRIAAVILGANCS